MHALTVVRNSGDDVIATPHHTTPHRVPQSKFQREVQVNSDKLLEEFEAENEQLLGDLSKSRANLVALQEQTANEARARAEDAEAEGSMPHAQVAEMEARLAVQAAEGNLRPLASPFPLCCARFACVQRRGRFYWKDSKCWEY